MTPRVGRPKIENARTMKVDTRLTEEEEEKLVYCCEVLGLTKAEVVRKGIEKVYNEILSKEK
jgi:predicted DNA-binding protein